MTLITKQKVQQLIYILKQENSRSLFLSCLPGDFKRTRTKLDLARMDDYQPGFSSALKDALMKGGSVVYKPAEMDWDTMMAESDVTKKLSSLHDQGKTIEKEKGSNPMKIGFPILIQQNNSASTNCFAAPLFVWEIELVKGQNKWTIRASKDAPSKNHSLEGLVEAGGSALDLEPLYKPFTDGQPLEGFVEDFQPALQAFLEANPKIISDESPHSSGLQRIPFTNKSALVSDKAKPYRLQLLNAALLGKFAEGKVSIIRDLETNSEGIDDLPQGGILTASLGANRLDPSQASIIPDIISGEHVVLHGPPGTGKSQSITALITAAVSQGHRVAVVCQKLAALEVIESNLQELGIQDGIAKITNPVKDRRKIIDAARKMEEGWHWDLDGNYDFESVYEEGTYTDLSDSIIRAKKAGQQNLGTSKLIFKNAVARLLSLEASLESSEQVNLLRELPSEEQLIAWTSDLMKTLDSVQWLEEQYQHIKDALPLSELVNEKAETAQLGPDLAFLRKLLDDLLETKQTASDAKTAVRTILTEVQNRDQNNIKRIQATLELCKKALASTSRELQSSRAFDIISELGDTGFDHAISEIDAVHAAILQLDRDGFALKRHARYNEVSSASGIKKLFLKLFDKEAKAFLVQWDTFRKDTSRLKLHFQDNFEGLAEEAAVLKAQVEQAKQTYLSIELTDPTIPPLSAIALMDERTNWLQQVAEQPESFDSIPEISSLQDIIKSALQTEDASNQKINGIQWLRSAGKEALQGDQSHDVLARFEAHSTKLPVLKKWLKASEELLIDAQAFENQCSKWLEYHSLKHAIQQWDDIEHLPTDDLDIRQIEKEVESVRERVRQATKYAIYEHFQEGVASIYSHPGVRSFKQEFIKTGKKRKSLRKLYHRHPLGMTRLFPIHLTTPEVVCNLFEGQNQSFDLLIFDEASQVELQDAATCLLKGRSIVVAGDEHQMPPSQYFKVAVDHLFEEDDEDENEGANIEVESLLEFCQQQPHFTSRFLDFHYRSHHPYLIQFSNQAIYSRLVIRPSHASYTPIQFIDVQGTWENQHNMDEIDEIIRFLKEFKIPKSGVPKVMIGTLNVTQRTKMIRALEAEKQDSAFRDHLTRLEEAGLNVKNLENLQGDECDVLIISIGYGKTPTGKFSRSYGAINQKHGYRLLNVLITRARHKVAVFNSIPEEVHSMFEHELAAGNQGTWSRGLLHAYIQYASAIAQSDTARMQRVLDILKENAFHKSDSTKATEATFDSPFEEEVWDVLRRKFEEDEIQLQEPSMGFRIDMVVKPKCFPGLKIAVECDGEAYHSGWQNQLADFHREQLLRGAGYEFVRIWSRNWWMDARNSQNQLLQEIDRIMEGWSSTADPLPDWITDDASKISKKKPIKQPVEILDDAVATSNETKKTTTPSTDRKHLPSNRPDHVLAPCLVTAAVMSSKDIGSEVQYIFLSSHDSGFKGHSKDEWKHLGQKSGKMATLGEDSDLYKAFKGAEIGDTVEFRSNLFQVVALEFDY